MSQELQRALSDLHRVGRRQRAGLLAGLLFSLFAGLSLTSAAHAQAETPIGTFGGSAYGTFAQVKAAPISATLGYTALIGCPCLGTAGATLSNFVHSLSAGKDGKVLKADTILTTVSTTETGEATVLEKNTSRVEGLNSLAGLVTADAILAVANTTADATNINSNSDGSAFVNLRIADQQISGTVAPNTRIDLPGIGYAILRGETKSGNGTSAGAIQVEMITINITVNNSLGLEVGARIVVAHASSGFFRVPPGTHPTIVSGAAWAASANAAIGDLLRNRIGLLAAVSVGGSCQPIQNSVTKTNSIAALSVSPVLSLGSGVTTAVGQKTVTGGFAKTTATVQTVTLLNGLISASAVTAVAQTTIANGVRTRSTQGSGLVGLKVLRLPISDPAPNTRVDLPGFGFVILNEQIIPPASSNAPTQVNGIHIHITTTINPLHLPVGAEVLIAHAAAAAQVF